MRVTGLPVEAELTALFERVRRRTDGEVADYIPALAEARPEWFGVSLVTVDGGAYHLGDCDREFTIQSVSKPFVLGLALDEHGVDGVTERVGVEPSGDPFNAIEVDLVTHRPYNPMVNSGAIVTTSLVMGAGTDPVEPILRGFGRFAGRQLGIDEAVYASESATGDRNRAIGYLLSNFNMLRGDVPATLDAYFRQCSILVNTRDLATMGATLANRGVNPVTGRRALREEHVTKVLSVMATCGMYDYAGEWVFRVGLPAKSGVSGAVVAVLPGECAVAIYSPPLDEHGNSVRGIAFAEELSHRFGLHLMGSSPNTRSVIRRTYTAARVHSMRTRTAVEYTILRQTGQIVRVLEIQGDLRFGTVETLGRVVAEVVDQASWLVLDMTRVGAVDGAVVPLLRSLADVASASGAQLVLAGLPATLWGQVNAEEFVDVDMALEWCEHELLEAAGHRSAEEVDDLAACELFDGLGGARVDAIRGLGWFKTLAPRETIFREGDPADSIYFLVSGRVDVRLVNSESEIRIATLGPASVFGEVGALNGGTRSSSCVAVTAARCWAIKWRDLREACADDPAALEHLLTNVARTLAGRLHRADDERRALR